MRFLLPGKRLRSRVRPHAKRTGNFYLRCRVHFAYELREGLLAVRNLRLQDARGRPRHCEKRGKQPASTAGHI